MAVPEASPTPPPSGWTVDKRQAVGISLGLFCLGVILGAKLAKGMPAEAVERVVWRERPCAECAEKAKAVTEPVQSVPGDSSIPED